MGESSSAAASQSPGILMKCVLKSLGIKFPSVKNISTSCLSNWLENTNERAVALLDCRPEEEYAISHIQDSIAVGHQTLSEAECVAKCEEMLQGNPNPTIVCYCSLGYRSSDVAQNLTAFYEKSGKPCPEIYNLTGSLFQWAQEKRPMVDKNGQSTPFVHPYNAVFGKLVDKELRKEKL